MQKTIKLKDGTEVEICPLTMSYLEESFAFFKGLSNEDRAYLRRDVTKFEVVKQRIHKIKSGKVQRLIALHDGEIVADGTLELEEHDWEEHIGEFRLFVSSKFRRKGLGTRMVRELYSLAAHADVEDIVVKMMRPQIAAIQIFKKLGFSEDVTLKDYVKDLDGSKQDLIVMRCDLKSLKAEMEHFLSEMEGK